MFNTITNFFNTYVGKIKDWFAGNSQFKQLIDVYNHHFHPLMAEYSLVKWGAISLLMLSNGLVIILGLRLRNYNQKKSFLPSKIGFPWSQKHIDVSVILRPLNNLLRESIRYIILLLVLSYLFWTVGVLSTEITSSYWPTIMYVTKVLMISFVTLKLYVELSQWIKASRFRYRQSISAYKFAWIKINWVRDNIRDVLKFLLRLSSLVINICLGLLIAYFLETEVQIFASWQLFDRIAGLSIVTTSLFFLSELIKVKNSFRELVESLVQIYVPKIRLKLITLFTKRQLLAFLDLIIHIVLTAVIVVLTYIIFMLGVAKLVQPSVFLYVFVKQVVLASIIVLGAYRSIRYARFHHQLYKKKVSLYSRMFKAICSIRKGSFFYNLNIEPLLRVLFRLFTFATYILVLYVALSLILNLFPFTQNLAESLLIQIIKPIKSGVLAILSFIPNVVIIGFVLLVTNYLLDFIRFFFTEVNDGNIVIDNFYQEFAMPTYKIIRFLIYVIAFIIIFPYLPGAGSPAFKGVSVFLGVLISLGSTSVVSNLVAGILITYMRPFKVGDRVKIADSIGDIVEKNLLVTRIKTLKNEFVAIPNSLVLGTHITNFSFLNKEVPIILHSTVSIGYNTDWKKVHELLINAAKNADGVLDSPEPFVLQKKLNDFYIEYEINAFTKNVSSMPALYSRLHESIQDAFNAAGVEILSPHYRALKG